MPHVVVRHALDFMIITICLISVAIRYIPFRNNAPPDDKTVLELQKNPHAVHLRYPQRCPSRWRTSTSSPDGTDTSLASLYRMYEFLVIDWNLALHNEIEYFSNQHTWVVKNVPDPQDPDPVRYAVLAVLTRLLCKAFNRNIERGLPRDTPPVDFEWDELPTRLRVLESVPEWAQKVPRVRPEGQWYILINQDGVPSEADPYVSDDFKDFGILAHDPHHLFV